MRTRFRFFLLGVLLAASLGSSGCLFVWNRSSSYPGVVGAEFTTRREFFLFPMHEHQYDFVPYHLETSRSSYGQFADFVEAVPAGARIVVLEAKFRSNIDAGFDYLIADLFIPGRASSIRFEQMIGTPKDAASIDSIWAKTK